MHTNTPDVSGLQVLPSGRESLKESKASDAVLKGFPAAFLKKEGDISILIFFSRFFPRFLFCF